MPRRIFLLAFLVLSGCGRPAGDGEGAKMLPGADAPGERHYPLRGEVLKIDSARKLLTVRHEAVAGLMPAMTMEFAVSAGDAAAARPGERIRADLILSRDGGTPRLVRIWPDDRAGAGAIADGARMLREDTHNRGDSAYREVGETLPDFALYDQSGRVVDSRKFRGKQVMLNFIFTRCPVANMCPASTAKMMASQRLAREAGIGNIEFVSITLDPTYDTPGVLKEYAEVRGIDTANFSFLTGPEGAIRDLLTQFGVIAEFDGDLVKHTLATLLIDPRGTIIWRADGTAWEPSDFVSRMHRG
jgi:protein SCO1/2